MTEKKSMENEATLFVEKNACLELSYASLPHSVTVNLIPRVSSERPRLD